MEPQQTTQDALFTKKMLAIVGGLFALIMLASAGAWILTSTTFQQPTTPDTSVEPILMTPIQPIDGTSPQGAGSLAPTSPSDTKEPNSPESPQQSAGQGQTTSNSTASPSSSTTTSSVVTSTQRPAITAGDTWTWTDRTEKFLRTEKDLLVFQLTSSSSSNVASRYRTTSFNMVKDISKTGAVSNTRDPHTGILQFPITVGSTWTHSYTTTDGTIKRKASYKVTGYSKLITAAGMLDAFKVEGIDQRDDRPYGIEVTYWYAPEAKAIVQMRGIDGSNGTLVGGWNYSLVSYSIAR